MAQHDPRIAYIINLVTTAETADAVVELLEWQRCSLCECKIVFRLTGVTGIQQYMHQYYYEYLPRSVVLQYDKCDPVWIELDAEQDAAGRLTLQQLRKQKREKDIRQQVLLILDIVGMRDAAAALTRLVIRYGPHDLKWLLDCIGIVIALYVKWKSGEYAIST